jgi:CheY-like chemotaxis protein
MNGALSQGTAVPRFLPAGAPVRAGQTATDPRQLPAKIDRPPATVLVVDDEPRMRRVARRMLSELGYQVLEAENAAAAARLLDTDVSIDLLFTDVVMPGESDGRALGRWARRTHPGLGVLLTSGFIQQTAVEDSSGAEPLPLLSKPYSKEQLQHAVQTLLRGQTA